MNPLSLAAVGIKRDRDTTVRYEVHREREDGRDQQPRPALVEAFDGLDRARIAALGYALDGSSQEGSITGVVRIFMVLTRLGTDAPPQLIDEFDERVASRLLNEVTLPHADELAVSLDQLQGEVDALRPYR